MMINFIRRTRTKRFMIIVMLFIFFLFNSHSYIAFADSLTVIPPQFLSVAKQDGLSKIDVNYDGTISVYLSWQYSGSPSDFTYFELYITDNPSSFIQRFNIYQNDPALSFDSASRTYTYKMDFLPNNQRLASGTVYYAKVRAAKMIQYDYGTVVNYSSYSNTISFLSPIFVDAQTNSETSIDVVWDDVYYNGERIDYDIFISKDISFTTPTKYQIDGDKITVYQSQPIGGRVEILPNRKLKYTILNLSPSSLYYVKVVPRNLPSDVFWRDPQTYSQPNPKVFAEATTYIQAQAVRLTQDIVKISWMSVSIAVGKNYEIYQGSINQIPYLIGTVSSSNNEFYRTVSVLEEVFFRVQVDVTDAFGRKITVRSRDLGVFPYTLPFEPPAAEGLSAYPKSTDTITLKLKIPSDTDVLYDISYKKYGLSDSEYVLFLSNYQTQDSNVEKDVYGNPTGYYKIDITNLQSNTIYVVKVIVKKRFFDYQTASFIYKESAESYAISYTLSGQIAPPSVPTSVYVDSYTDTTVTISWEPIYIPNTTIVDDSISYVVNYAVYNNNMNLSKPDTIPIDGSIIISKPQIDNLRIRATISSLSPDTRYIFFVKSRRIIDNTIYDSLPSNIVMVTTLIQQQIPIPQKPPMIDDISVVSSTYNSITYSWRYIPNIFYEVQITDNIQNASSWQTISDNFLPAVNDINYQTSTCYFTARNLKPDTLYYLRVRTYILNNNQKIYSDYSNTASARTLKIPPPQTPIAFGIKDYGKDYAVFVWEVVESGRSYILEIAENLLFSNSQKINVQKDKSEQKVDNLKPNTRYYVRLYAVGDDSQLSAPTYAISFVTKKDVSEYTNIFDNIPDITQPLEVREDVLKNSMVVEITYKYTALSMDSEPISIDFTKRTNSNITKFSLKIRYDVLNSLERLKKRCYINLDNANANFDFSALSVSDTDLLLVNTTPTNVYVELLFEKAKGKFNTDNPSSEVYDIQLSAYNNLKQVGARYFNLPVSITLENTNPSVRSLPYTYNNVLLKWEMVKSYSFSSDKKTVTFDIAYPQAVALLKKGSYKDIGGLSYTSSLVMLFRTFESDDDSEYLEPSKNVTKFELATFLVYYSQNKKLYRFDIINDFVQKAYKAGIIDDYDIDEPLTKEMMFDMIVRFYEVYTSNAIVADNTIINRPNISERYLSSIKKAYQKGWILDYSTFNPKSYANREYVLATLYKVLTEVR